jgi:hypothetical protein
VHLTATEGKRIAGAPVLSFVSTVTQSLWNGIVLADTPVPIEKMKLIADAAYARCDAKDGLKDGLIGRFTSKRISGVMRPVTRQCSGTPSAAAIVSARRSACLRFRSCARRSAMRCGTGRASLSDACTDRGDQEDLCGRACPRALSSSGVLRECFPLPPQTWMPSAGDGDGRPRHMARERISQHHKGRGQLGRMDWPLHRHPLATGGFCLPDGSEGPTSLWYTNARIKSHGHDGTTHRQR